MTEQTDLFPEPQPEPAPAPLDRAAISLSDALSTAKWWTRFACDVAAATGPLLRFPKALERVEAAMLAGERTHKPREWRQHPVAEHLAHARAHLAAFAAGDRNEDHLQHAACRLLMAIELGAK